MPNHSWKISKDGFVECTNCGMEVKAYRVKHGGLGPCVQGKWKINSQVKDDFSALVMCKNCKMLVPNTIFCVNCAAQMHPLNWLGVIE